MSLFDFSSLCSVRVKRCKRQGRSYVETTMNPAHALRTSVLALWLVANSAFAVDTVLYNNDFPDGKIGAASGGAAENETADYYLLTEQTLITSGSFTGLIPKGAAVSRVGVLNYGVDTVKSSNTGKAITRNYHPSH